MKTKRLTTGKIKYVLFVVTLICPFINGFVYAQDKNSHNHQMNDSTMMMHRQHMIHSQSSIVVSAIHKWFDAQLKDHGSDAKSHE